MTAPTGAAVAGGSSSGAGHIDNTERFTDHLWRETAALRASIDDMEFLRRLGDGTLPLDVFRTYMEQDLLYLTGYAKALALVAATSPDPVASGFWAGAAASATSVEASLHQDLLGSDALPPAATEPEHSRACLGYVSYLIATAATESYAVAAAAVLPCFWIYADVGRRRAAGAEPGRARAPRHPDARGVAPYDGPAVPDAVSTARSLVDDAAAVATDAERAAMTAAFTTASRYEFLLWDTALHPQPSPA